MIPTSQQKSADQPRTTAGAAAAGVEADDEGAPDASDVEARLAELEAATVEAIAAAEADGERRVVEVVQRLDELELHRVVHRVRVAAVPLVGRHEQHALDAAYLPRAYVRAWTAWA